MVNVQRTLLKIINSEIYLNQTLHGQCTVFRSRVVGQSDPRQESFADVSFRFGPSMPHDSIPTVLRFFGMPELWVTFMKKWLKASLSFDHGAPGKGVFRPPIPSL